MWGSQMNCILDWVSRRASTVTGRIILPRKVLKCPCHPLEIACYTLEAANFEADFMLMMTRLPLLKHCGGSEGPSSVEAPGRAGIFTSKIYNEARTDRKQGGEGERRQVVETFA